MRPRGWLGSATRPRALIDDGVYVRAELLPVDRRCAHKEGDSSLRANELTMSQRRQLANWDPVASDDERLAAVKRAHDLAALISKLPLSDFSRHITKRSTRATRSQVCNKPGSFAAWCLLV